MNSNIGNALLSNTHALPSIRGVAYVIITEKGKILYSSPQCEKNLSLHEEDDITWTAGPGGNQGYIDYENPHTGEETRSNVSIAFDLVWHGEIAKMLLFSQDKLQEKSSEEIESVQVPAKLSSTTPWMTFRCDFDEQLKITSLSQHSFSLTGYKPETLLNGDKSYRNLISEIDREMIYKIIRKAVDNHQPYNVLYRIQKAGEDFVWAEEHGQAITNNKGIVQYIEGWVIDVTDRKKIEDALWESESRYRSMVEASPDAVLLLDRNGQISLCNKHFCELLGIQNPETILGKKIIDFIDLPEKLPDNFDFPSYWESLPAAGQTFNLVGQNDVLIPMEANLSVIYGNSGKVNACIVIARDVRQRIQSQQALRESEARYRAIVENNPEMIVRFDEMGRVSFANTAFLSFVNLSAAELFGNKLDEKVKNKAHHLARKLINLVTPDMSPLESEFSIHLTRDDDRWYRWRATAIKDESGTFIEYQAVGEDITDRKKAENANKESENRLHILMENIKLASVILDLDGKVTFCNSYFSELSGWEKDEILGQNWIHKFIPSDYASTVKNSILNYAYLDQVPIRFENPILTKSGERRLISWTNTLMKDTRGHPLGIASIGEDITEKNEMERIQEAILKISRAANEAGNLDHLYRSIHEILKKLSPVDNFYIALYDKETNMIRFPYYVDQFDSQPAPKKFGKGLTEYVIRTGKTTLVDPEKFQQLLSSKEVILSGSASLDWIGVPLKIENEIIGVMVAQTYSPGIRYKERDEKILSFVSNQVAMAIDRKQREQALLSSQKRNQLLITASTDAIFINALDGSILDCNDIALQMYGYTRDEMLKLNVTDLVDPNFLIDKPNYLEWELSQESSIPDILNVHKDGSIFPVEVSIRQAMSDDEPVLVAFVRDITAQKVAAREIVENEAKFRTLSETTTAGIFIYRNDQYLYVNPMWCQITGYSEDELMGMKPMDILNAEVDLDSVSHIEQTSDGEIAQARIEHTLSTRTGEICTIDLNLTRSVFEGKPAILGTAIDITSRKQREHELEVIAELGEAMRIDISREKVISTAMTKLIEIMDLDGAYFSLVKFDDGMIELKKAYGVWQALENSTLHREQGLSGHIISTGLPYINNRPESDPYLRHPEYVKEFLTVAGVPLIAKGETFGALVIGSKRRLNENDLRLLKAIGDLTASAIHRADLFQQTVQQTEELRHAYDSTLEGWALAMELRDKETQGHSLRIAKMTLKLAQRFDVPDDQMENIRRGALLHDIGKLAIPDSILLKNGPLTPQEWEIMQKHPTYAYEMLSQIKDFKNSIDIPYCHHEWYDGSGYPRGLEGEEIPLASRIFSIIDVWDALTSDRPYRKAWKKKEALAHIINQAGTHFDPNIVDEFIKFIVKES